jgi:PAS domain S-box-containing protein
MVRMQAFLGLMESVSRAQTASQVYEAALDCVSQALDVERAAILLFDPDGVMRFKAWRGLSERYRTAVEGHTPWRPDTRDAKPVVIADIANDASLGGLREVVLEEGVRALAFVPLQSQGRLLGKLMLYHPEPHADTPEDLREAMAVADQIALAIDRRRAADDVRGLNELLGKLMQGILAGVLFMDENGKARYVNPAFTGIFALDAERDVLGRDCREIVEGVVSQVTEGAEQLCAASEAVHASGGVRELELHLKDGRVLEVTFSSMSAANAAGGHLVQVVDVTPRRRLEAQLLQAQKMESIGRLAGGVAHDFNNLLTAVIGYVDLVASTLPDRSEEQAQLRTALDAAEQASALTRQLLTFARRQPVQPAAQDLGAILERLAPMMRHLLPANIALLRPAPNGPAWVFADPGQLEQLLVNLVLNARDAMPEGGTLTLAVQGDRLRDSDAVRLEVRDTGVGMDPDNVRHVFEPFYTTKGLGRGTGLGLATVYGIVQQCGGDITVDSAPGKGTAFHVLLPRHQAPEQARALLRGDLPEGHETVLLVEDDEPVRSLVAMMLRRLGYEALTAENADEALRRAKDHRGTIHLLLTDIVMPGMGGRELAVRMRMTHPGLRVLLMSGYTPSMPLGGEAGDAFLAKPFAIDLLARRVRETLGAPAESGAAAR